MKSEGFGVPPEQLVLRGKSIYVLRRFRNNLAFAYVLNDMANQDFDLKSMPAFENNLPEQESSKTSITCDLARLLVRATAVKKAIG